MVNNAINAYVKDILRNGFKFVSTDPNNDHSNIINMLNQEWQKYECDIILRSTLEKIMGLGGAMIYPKLKGDNKILDKELKAKDLTTIGKDSLEYFQVIEPTWCWALGFNASEPLRPDFYKPQLWSIMGTTVHISRLIKCVIWEMPDLIKPIYQFYGLSLTQKMLQSLRNFDIIQTEIPSMVKRMNFNILKLPLGEFANNRNKLITRVKDFIYSMTNWGIFLVNKDSEEYDQVTRNISGLDDLVARFAELLSTTIQIPVTKLLGVSPKGFSTNDETGHRNWYDLVTGLRITQVQPIIMQKANYLALNKGIELPNTITIEWGALEDINEHDEAKAKDMQAKSEVAYVAANILAVDEVRQRIASDPESGYNNIDVNRKIEAPAQLEKDNTGKKDSKDKKKDK
jgi:phage-related protein (TIGR01555 family)